MEGENNKTKYILPHQLESWKNRRAVLMQVIEANLTLEEILSRLNHMNATHNTCWSTKSIHYLPAQQDTLDVLRYIALKALEVETLFPKGIDLSFSHPPLSSGKSWLILTKLQCCCLVANMFLGTIVDCYKDDFPEYLSFRRLSTMRNEITKTLIYYFRKIRSYEHSDPDMLRSNNVVYVRLAESCTKQQLESSEEPLCQVEFHTHGSIESLDQEIQIDFANESIGGFFLNHTFTQEDILFINSPELMPAMILHQFMQPHQSILMIGAERFAKYSGYLETYRCEGEVEDKRPLINVRLDETTEISRVRDSWISAIDAIPRFRGDEFGEKCLMREINKAYCGFHIGNLDQGVKAVSTGNWGSGAFGGNLQYKFIIQWIAASAAKRSIHYFPFTDPRAKGIPQLIQRMKHMKVGVMLKLVLGLSQRLAKQRNVFSVLMEETKREE